MEDELKITTISDDQELPGDNHNTVIELTDLPDLANDVNALKTQIEVLQDKLLRAAADSENLRRRLEKNIEETKDYAIVSFAKDLLSVMDNLARTLEHTPEAPNDNQIANVISGIAMTKNELDSVFKKYHLEVIEPVAGEKFDYNLHHAISQISIEKYPPGSIAGIMQIGYKLKNRLLRPAIVTVAKKAD